MSDWLAALDDLLRGQPDHCTACGKTWGQARTDIIEVGARSVAVIVCLPCHAKDTHQVALRKLLQQRYAQRGETV